MKRLALAAIALSTLAAGCGDSSTPAKAPPTTTATVAKAEAPKITSPRGGADIKAGTITISGRAAAGRLVDVSASSEGSASKRVTVGADGRWKVRLAVTGTGEVQVLAAYDDSLDGDSITLYLPEPTYSDSGSGSAPAALECEEPTGQEKASLRFHVRARDHELRDDPWVVVRSGGKNYMAAELDYSGPRAVLLVVFPTEGQYLAGTKAVNGMARTFTDLPEAGPTIPKAGEKALDCMG